MTEEEAAKELSARLERIQSLCKRLRGEEMLDSIVICTTYTTSGWTQYATGAAGNTFACTASAEKFVNDKKLEWED